MSFIHGMARESMIAKNPGGCAGVMEIRGLPAVAVAADSFKMFHCEMARTRTEVMALAADWRRLQGRARDVQAFQSPAWCLAWLDAFNATGEGKRQPLVVMVRDRTGEPVLLWPLMRELYPLRLSVITWLTDPFCQYGDVLTSLSGAALDAALDTALAALKKEGADLLRLRLVREDATIAPWLRRRFLQTGEEYGAPWLDLSPYASVEELEKRYNRTQRRRRRKIRKALEKHFNTSLTFRRMSDVDEMKRAVGEILAHKRVWLKEKGLVSRALFCERTADFLRALVERAAEDGQGPQCVITVLQAGDEPLSWELGMRLKGRHYAYITAHRPELTKFSIGRLHMDLSQKQALTDGMTAFDLLVPDAPHKKSWSSAVAPLRNHFLPLSLRGRLMGQAYLCHVRPFLREVYHRLPAQLRCLLHLSDIHEHDHGVG